MRGALIFQLTNSRHHITVLNVNVPNCTGWAKKTGLFLEVCNSRIC